MRTGFQRASMVGLPGARPCFDREADRVSRNKTTRLGPRCRRGHLHYIDGGNHPHRRAPSAPHQTHSHYRPGRRADPRGRKRRAQRIAVDNELGGVPIRIARSCLVQLPQYAWQSTSASTDFEPKFSLAPLIVGTLKAAFTALFAIHVAALGAIYARISWLRAWIKPSVELMGAAYGFSAFYDSGSRSLTSAPRYCCSCSHPFCA